MAENGWEGYLLKFGDKSTGVAIPNSMLIMSDENEQTPNQREEIKAVRDDDTRVLTRVTSSGQITKMQYAFKPMNIKQRKALNAVMKHGLVNEKQRKYKVTYWNDENLRYETGNFYIPDITFHYKEVSEETLTYRAFVMQLIGYETSKEA